MHSTYPTPVIFTIATCHILASSCLFNGSFTLRTFVNVQTLFSPTIKLISLIQFTAYSFVGYLFATWANEIFTCVALHILIFGWLFRVQNSLTIGDGTEKQIFALCHIRIICEFLVFGKAVLATYLDDFLFTRLNFAAILRTFQLIRFHLVFDKRSECVLEAVGTKCVVAAWEHFDLYLVNIQVILDTTNVARKQITVIYLEWLTFDVALMIL